MAGPQANGSDWEWVGQSSRFPTAATDGGYLWQNSGGHMFEVYRHVSTTCAGNHVIFTRNTVESQWRELVVRVGRVVDLYGGVSECYGRGYGLCTRVVVMEFEFWGEGLFQQCLFDRYPGRWIMPDPNRPDRFEMGVSPMVDYSSINPPFGR